MPDPSKQANSLDACKPELNATVSASAGSGKTWLLITRIVRLLIDGAEPGNIIALTFTRKAAGEMQIRLNQRLFEMATASDDELEKLLRLIDCDIDKNIKNIAAGLYEKLMHSLHPIRIQTFHSFCQDILSRFPLEADIPPGFDLLEDTSLLERQALQMLFDSAGTQANHHDSKRLAEELDTIMQACNGPDNTQTALHSFLSHRSDWWAYTSHTRKAVDFACDALTRSLQIDNAVADEKHGPVSQFLDDTTTQQLKVFASLLREINNKTSDKHADSIELALKDEAEHNAAEQQARFSLIKSAFIKQDGEILAQGRKLSAVLEKKLGSENANRFIELHLEIAEKIQNVSEQLKRILTLKINKAWFFAGNKYVEIFQQLKRETRQLDFTDLEWKCYELLQHADNAHWVQYKIDQRIDHLLIDEFQDTNPTQWHLLSPILEEIAANPEQRPRSVFLVGDEKQSIYSFRRANPALQAQASSWLADNLSARATPLDFSRRSSAAIIDCVNQIFEQQEVKSIMTGYTTHGTHLNELPGQVMLCDLFEEDDDETSDIEPVYFRNPLQQPREISLKTVRHKEADYIARQILRLTNTPELITDDGTVRPVEFGDIIILMRNRTHVDIYEQALKQHGIAFIGNKKGGLLDNLEIQDLSCLLNTLITPYNNLAFAQVLKSPVFNASDEDLIQLARYQATPNKNVTHWYDRLLLLAAEPDNTADRPALSKALQRAAALLPRWQKMAEQLPVHDCLDTIYSQGNIIKRYIAANREENQQKVAANCQRFLELSLETDSGRYPSITRFLQNLNHLKNYSSNPPEEPLSQSNESRVRLMTIHGSKGLEAPVVFLADCNSTPGNKNAYASLIRWPANKPQPANFQLQLSKDNTDQITAKLQQEKLNEQSREELNLLYVALTRARERLYISGIASSRRQQNSWYQIIANGLKDIAESETGIDEINGKLYLHLSYDRAKVTPAEYAETAENTPMEIDQHLLKPVELASIPGITTPSLNTEENIAAADDEAKTITVAKDVNRDLAIWRGIIIHRMIELLCNAENQPASEQVINNIRQRIKTEVTLQKPAYLEHLDGCLEEAIATVNHPDCESIFKPATTAQTYNEMPLMYMAGQQAIYGVIDRLIKTEDSISIIDYKSHQLAEGETLQEAAQQFSVQLTYYRNGVEKLWPGHAIKTGVLFTYHKKVIWLN